MPAGAVCPCGALTRRPSKRCQRCERDASQNQRLRRQVYDDPRWTRTRLIVWARDRWTCVKCGRQDVGNAERSLDCHHKSGVLELLARRLDPFDPVRCETRCKRCHAAS